MRMSRRDLLKMLPVAASAVWMTNFKAIAAPYAKSAKITNIKVMGLDNLAESCLVKIETDAGLFGLGESGHTAGVTRALVETMKPLLIGQDPLAIEKYHYLLTSFVHPEAPVYPVVGGIDIALWDLAGKIMDRPPYQLLGGAVQRDLPVYSHGNGVNMLDKGACKAWADEVKAAPEGYHTFKFTAFVPPARPSGTLAPPAGAAAGGGFMRNGGKGGFPFSQTLDLDDFRRIAIGYGNLREAVGPDVDLAAHCLNNYDLRSAMGMCKALEPVNPMWIEDPLSADYTPAWKELRQFSRIPILTGERVMMLKGFKPYLDNQVVDMLHVDPPVAGGITASREIASYAALTQTPIGFHSGTCSLVQFYASLHLTAATPNIFKVENMLGKSRGFKENMATVKLAVRNAMLRVPEGPGLGLELNVDWVKSHLQRGEVWWG